MPGLYVNIIMMKWHQYMRFHQSAELLIFSWLYFCWIWHRPTGTFEPSMAKAHNPHPSRRECHDCRPHAPLPCLNIAQLFSGEKPNWCHKKSPPQLLYRTPPIITPFSNSSSLPSHRFIPLANHHSHPPHAIPTHPGSACGWKSTFIGFLFQSTMPPCDTAITALRTSLPKTEKHMEARLLLFYGTSEKPQVLLWNYGSTMVFYVGCQGKHKLKDSL